MLTNDFDFDFCIHPGRALLLLEAEDLLSDPPPEDSPLRRNIENNTQSLRLVWDTRKIQSTVSSAPTIFVARKTERFDTHTEVATLLNKGHYVIVEKDKLTSALSNQNRSAGEQWQSELLTHPHVICVSSTEVARNLLIQAASGLLPSDWTTLAITGTNGKTSSTQIAAAMLEKLSQKDVLRLGTLGIQIAGRSFENPFPTQPDYPGLLAALRMSRDYFSCNQVVMEATSIGIVEGRLGSWPVQCAAFLNLTQDHLDYHGTMDRYLDAKLDLFRKHLLPSGQLAVNCDDRFWEKVTSAAAGKTRFCVGFGHPAQRETFLAKCGSLFGGVRYLEVSHKRTSIVGVAGQWTLWLDSQTSVGQCQYAVRLLGEVQHENVAAAAAMMVALGYPLTQIAGVCTAVEPIQGRLDPVRTSENETRPTVLVDYAHSPDALEKTLRTCKALLPKGGRLICVFGCGGDRDPTKRPLMGHIAAQLADKVWVTSDNPRTEEPHQIVSDIVEGIPENNKQSIAVEVDRKQAIYKAVEESNEKDIILIAGKGHEDYQIIGAAKYPFSDSEVARQALSSKRNI